jgi:hypothetical protein
MEIKYKNKKRLLVGVIIILIIINITAIGTISYQKFDRKRDYKSESNHRKVKDGDHSERVKHYVKKELNLSESQCSIYYQSLDKNFEKTRILSEEISRIKKGIIDQTFAENPDTSMINLYSDSIGYLHKQIQYEMNRHFLLIKKSLDTNQQFKLKEILYRMNEKDWKKGDLKTNSRSRNCDN